MFSNLKQNNIFYILDKNDMSFKIGKVANIGTINYSNPMMQTVKVSINTNDGNYTFEQLPANLNLATDENLNMIVADNKEELAKEVEIIVSASKQHLDAVPYNEMVVEKGEEILIKLNPRIAKEKEQENKLNALESKVTGVEKSLSNIEVMMSKLLNKNIGDNNDVHGRDN